jgi:fibronectin-binding autotransporter adhesin
MNVRIQRISQGFLAAIAIAGSLVFAISSAHAATYYWDGNNDTSGFGTASGTWADPTAGTLTSGWSTSSTGVTVVDGNSVTTTTADAVNFGTNSVGFGLAAGTITVSGTVNASSLTFGSQSGAVTLSGGTINLAAAGSINLAGGAITIDSVISGAGTSLTKSGGNQLTLTGLNTYTGATRIGSSTGGYLAVTSIANGGIASGIGASSSAASNLVLANDNFGGLNYIGSTNASTDRDFTLANGSGAYSGAIASSGTGTLTFTSTNAVSYSGTANSARNFVLAGSNTGQNTLNARLVDNGTGALTFTKSTGTATWVLANETSSYTGSTTIRGTGGVGVLSVSKMADYGTDSSIGKGTAGAAIGFDDAALVYTGSGDNTDRLVRTDRSGAIINNGTGALNFTATGNFNVTTTQTLLRGLTFGGTNGGTISGTIQNNSNALSVSKTGTGTWTLGGNNTYTGTTGVNAGTLRLQSGAASINQTLGGLANQVADGTLNSDKSGAGSIATTFSSYARSAGATGNIVSTGGTNGTDNSVNITGGTQGFINAGLFFGGSNFAARNATDGYVRALNYATTGGDPNTVDVDTVTASRHVKLATTSYSGAGVTLLSLNLAGGGVNWTNTSGNLVTPGIIKSGGGSQSTISGGNVSGGSNTELVIRTDTSSDSLAITSNLTQGSGALTKSGAGTLTLSGTNTFTGQTHVNAGTLSIGANVNLGAESTGATLNLKGGTLQATGTFGLFNGTAGTNDRAVALRDQSGIEVTGSNTLTIAGVMSNLSSTYGTTGGFNKTGTGTLVLSGTNTYTGVTNVNAGTLNVTGAGSINTTSAINVAAGARFANNSSVALALAPTLNGAGTGSRAVYGGTGTLNAALTLDNVGDVLSPGNSPGIQTFGVDQSWASNSYDWELNDWTASVAGTNIDQINITGNLTLTGAAPGSYILNVLSLTSGNLTGDVPNFSEVNNSWTILTTTTGISGFDADYWTINDDGFSSSPTATGTWNIAQSGNNLVLNYVAVPEPTTIALLASGVAIGGYLRARRRRVS